MARTASPSRPLRPRRPRPARACWTSLALGALLSLVPGPAPAQAGGEAKAAMLAPAPGCDAPVLPAAGPRPVSSEEPPATFRHAVHACAVPPEGRPKPRLRWG